MSEIIPTSLHPLKKQLNPSLLSLSLIITLSLMMSTAHSQVFRSVKILIENDTNAALVIQSYAALRGTWQAGGMPQVGQMIETKAVSMPIVNQNNEVGVGVAGMIYLQSQNGGLIALNWNLPWSGQTAHQARTYSDTLKIQSQLIQTDPTNIVWLLNITNQSPPDEE